jgi:hypothetical protein
MDRQEFLDQLWRRFLRPTLLLVVITIVIRFLFNVLTNDGTERQLVYVFLGLTAVLTLFFVLRLTLDIVSVWIRSGVTSLPTSFQRIIQATSKPINYLGLFALLVLVVFMYLNQNFYGMLLPGIFFLTHLKRLLTAETEPIEKHEI